MARARPSEDLCFLWRHHRNFIFFKIISTYESAISPPGWISEAMEDFGLSAIIYLLIVLTTDNTLSLERKWRERILNLSDGGNISFRDEKEWVLTGRRRVVRSAWRASEILLLFWWTSSNKKTKYVKHFFLWTIFCHCNERKMIEVHEAKTESIPPMNLILLC